jgi:hypothetical protein
VKLPEPKQIESALMVAGVVAAGYVLWRLWGTGASILQTTGEALEVVNPLNRNNGIASGVNALGGTVAGDTSGGWTLGGWIYEKTHPDAPKGAGVTKVKPRPAQGGPVSLAGSSGQAADDLSIYGDTTGGATFSDWAASGMPLY